MNPKVNCLWWQNKYHLKIVLLRLFWLFCDKSNYEPNLDKEQSKNSLSLSFSLFLSLYFSFSLSLSSYNIAWLRGSLADSSKQEMRHFFSLKIIKRFMISAPYTVLLRVHNVALRGHLSGSQEIWPEYVNYVSLINAESATLFLPLVDSKYICRWTWKLFWPTPPQPTLLKKASYDTFDNQWHMAITLKTSVTYVTSLKPITCDTLWHNVTQ
jgi:hypothetical protein